MGLEYQQPGWRAVHVPQDIWDNFVNNVHWATEEKPLVWGHIVHVSHVSAMDTVRPVTLKLEPVTAGTTQQVRTVKSALMVIMEMQLWAASRTVSHAHVQGVQAVPQCQKPGKWCVPIAPLEPQVKGVSCAMMAILEILLVRVALPDFAASVSAVTI